MRRNSKHKLIKKRPSRRFAYIRNLLLQTPVFICSHDTFLAWRGLVVGQLLRGFRLYSHKFLNDKLKYIKNIFISQRFINRVLKLEMGPIKTRFFYVKNIFSDKEKKSRKIAENIS